MAEGMTQTRCHRCDHVWPEPWPEVVVGDAVACPTCGFRNVVVDASPPHYIRTRPGDVGIDDLRAAHREAERLRAENVRLRGQLAAARGIVDVLSDTLRDERKDAATSRRHAAAYKRAAHRRLAMTRKVRAEAETRFAIYAEAATRMSLVRQHVRHALDEVSVVKCRLPCEHPMIACDCAVHAAKRLLALASEALEPAPSGHVQHG